MASRPCELQAKSPSKPGWLTLDPACFVGRRAFIARMARLSELIKATPPASRFEEVLVPGEPEARAAEQARARGIEPP